MNQQRVVLFGAMLLMGAAARADTATIDDIRVAPLVKSHWDQRYAGGNTSGGDKCYNYYTPGASYCGCGPTALAQIMRYHAWPRSEVNTNYLVDRFDGLNKHVTTVPYYTCKYQGGKTNLTMIGGIYDWTKMPYETQTSGTPEAEREMIGRLCYDIGVSMGADYNMTAGTGVSSPAAVHNLPGNFHYADAAAIEFSLTTNMKECTREIFEQAILPNLDAGLPCGVMISGDKAGAHIVVCDGYGYHQNDGKLYVHLNVGYSGKWDGWFAYGDAWHINGYDYTIVRGLIFNISPDLSGPIVSGHVVDAEKQPLIGATLAVSRNGEAITNLVTNARGEYNFKAEPGDYDVRVSYGQLTRTVYMKLEPAISSAYLQTGEYIQEPVAVRIANKRNEDIVLDAALPKVETPFSIPADGTTFTGSQFVELACDTDGADIYYTTDGSYPTREATRYTGPFEITAATTVRAVAIKGDASSSLGTFAFVESTYGDVLGCPTTPWTSGGHATWFKDTEGLDTYDVTGTDTKNRLRSGEVDLFKKGSESWLEASIDGPAKMSFDYHFYPYQYCSMYVVQDGSVTNLNLKGPSYTQLSADWTSHSLDFGEGLHTLRISYVVGGSGGGSSFYGIHLRNMKIVYPNVLTTSLGSIGVEQWTWLTFANGVESGRTWNQLGSSSAKVTINGQNFERELTVDQDATMESLTLKGVTKLVSANGHKLSANTVKVDGTVTIGAGSLEASSALMLMTKSSTVVVADGIDLVPVSGVSGAKVVSAKTAGATTYSLEIGYASPFSAQVTGSSVRWSDLVFTDRNNNSAKWSALDADAKAQVNLNVAAQTTLTMDAAVSIRTLTVTGAGALTLTANGGHALTVSETATAHANLAVNGTAAQLGAATVADGKTLAVTSVGSVASVSGGGTFASADTVWPTDKGLADTTWTGTLRLTGDLSGVCALDSLTHAGSQVVFAGTLASGGEMCVTRELTVEGTANAQGAIVLSDLAARVIVQSGAKVNMASGLKHYEPVAETNGTDVIYTLKIAKVTHTGPYSATVDSTSVNWTNIVWTDANDAPGMWADLESAGDDVFTINAASDVTITMSGNETASKIVTTGAGMVTLLYDTGKDVPAGMKAALQDPSWKGTVKLAGSGRKFSNTDLADYGNAGSTIELAGSIEGSLKANGSCASSLKLASNCLFTLTGGTSGSSYTFSGKLLGTGEWYFGQYAAGQILCFTGDATEFRGGVNASYSGMVSFGSYGYNSKSNAMVIVNTDLVLGEGTASSVMGSVIVNGKLTIESGAKVSINWNTRTPVKLCSPAAQVVVKTGCDIVPVNGTARTDFASESVEGGTRYYFSSAAPEDPEPPKDPAPSIDETAGGTIAVNDAGEYVVTPAAESFMVAVNDVGTNTIVVPPQISWVFGVPPAQLRVRYGSQDITGAFIQADSGEGWRCLALSDEGSVKVGDETISVRPVLAPVGSDKLATVPFAVGDGVSVGVRSIPGLKYTLLRGATLEAVTDGSSRTEVTDAIAQSTRLQLQDQQPPSARAFYLIRVSTP